MDGGAWKAAVTPERPQGSPASSSVWREDPGLLSMLCASYECECVHVGALCARVMTLCPGLSAALPPSPGALSPSSRRSPPAGNPPPSSLPGELPQPLVASGTVSRPTILGPPSPARSHSGAPDANSQSTPGSSPAPSKLTVPLTRPAPP